MLTSQPFEKQQRSYEVFEKKHDMECTTRLWPFSAACGPTQGYLFPPCFMVSLQRHFSASTKLAHVKSWLRGRKQRGKVAFCTPINPCARRACSRSIGGGLLPCDLWFLFFLLRLRFLQMLFEFAQS